MARKKMALDANQLQQIEGMAGVGLKVDQMAGILGISKRTFERRMQDTPGAIDALEKGRAKASFTITKTAFEMAKSGQHVAMTIFWLKCREGWKESPQAIEHSGPAGAPIAIETKRDDLRKLIADPEALSALETLAERLDEQ
jgi:hypothetical protein